MINLQHMRFGFEFGENWLLMSTVTQLNLITWWIGLWWLVNEFVKARPKNYCTHLLITSNDYLQIIFRINLAQPQATTHEFYQRKTDKINYDSNLSNKFYHFWRKFLIRIQDATVSVSIISSFLMKFLSLAVELKANLKEGN